MKPHLSPSSLDLLSRCGIAWAFRYLDGIKLPPGFAAHKGTGLHKGASTNFAQKIESRADMPVTDIVDASVAGFDAAVNERGVILSADERGVAYDVLLGRCRDDVAGLAYRHAVDQAPDYQPTMVEETVKIELPGPRDLLGVIDLADESGRVIDLKTTTKSKPQSEADSSVQLTAYAQLYEARTGQAPASLRLDVLIQGKRETKRQVLETTRDEGDREALAARVSAALNVIESGAFMPAPPGAYWCSPEGCGFWNRCPHVNKRRK